LNWCKQGVLLLNASLTVRAYDANSHASIGWETLTSAIIRKISSSKKGIIFILWGKNAQSKIDLIDVRKHHILKATHPSPKSADRGGFFGCRHFSQTNQLLTKMKTDPINWDINFDPSASNTNNSNNDNNSNSST